VTVGSWGRAGHATGRPCGEGGRAPQVSAYSFTFPSVPGDESWPELPRQQVRWLVPVLDLLNHGADPNVAIERAPGAAERAFFARALRRIRCAATRRGRRLRPAERPCWSGPRHAVAALDQRGRLTVACRTPAALLSFQFGHAAMSPDGLQRPDAHSGLTMRPPHPTARSPSGCGTQVHGKGRRVYSRRPGEELVHRYNHAASRPDRSLLDYFFVDANDPRPLLCAIDLPAGVPWGEPPPDDAAHAPAR